MVWKNINIEKEIYSMADPVPINTAIKSAEMHSYLLPVLSTQDANKTHLLPAGGGGKGEGWE
jgi:hypothetical protein